MSMKFVGFARWWWRLVAAPRLSRLFSGSFFYPELVEGELRTRQPAGQKIEKETDSLT